MYMRVKNWYYCTSTCYLCIPIHTYIRRTSRTFSIGYFLVCDNFAIGNLLSGSHFVGGGGGGGDGLYIAAIERIELLFSLAYASGFA